MQDLDKSILIWLNSFAGQSFLVDWLIIFSAAYLLYIIIAEVFLFYAFDANLKRVKWTIFHAFFAGILSRFIFTEIIRLLYDRPRPFQSLEGIYQLIFRDGGGSMPSGHASFSFAVAMAVYFYYPKTSILFFLGALGMGVGRVAAGVHWPSDILIGAAVGVFSACILEFLFKKLQYK